LVILKLTNKLRQELKYYNTPNPVNMKLYNSTKNLSLIFILILISSVGAKAADFYWTGATSNDWGDGTNWSDASGGATVNLTPTAGDNIIFDINSPACVVNIDLSGTTFGTITLTADFANSLSFAAGGDLAATVLTINGGSMDLSGLNIVTLSSITLGGGTLNTSDAFEITLTEGINITAGNFIGGSSSEINMAGAITMSGGSFDGGSIVNLIANNLALSGGAAFTSTSQNLTLKRNTTGLILSNTGSIFNHNSGTVILDLSQGGSGKSISASLTFNNLIIDKGTLSRTFNFTGTTTIEGTLTLSGGGSNAPLTLQNGPVNIQGGLDVSNLTWNNTINPSHTSTLNFNASNGVVNITGNTTNFTCGKLPAITINLTGTASLELTDNINMAGNWTYNGNRPVIPNTSTITFHGTRSVDFFGTSTMSIFNLNIGASTGTQNSSTATFIGSASISGNLSISNASTLTLGGATSITGTTTISNGCTLTTTGSNHSLTFLSTLTNNGTLNTNSSSVIFAGNATIGSTGTLTGSASSYNVQGDFTNSGTLTPNNSTFTLAGTSTQNIDFRNSSTPTIHTLSSIKTSGTATITDSLIISNILQCTGGTLALGSGLVVLQSTGTSTSAQVGNSTGGTYTGTVTVQRFIPGSTGRKWRFMASPVTTSNFISANWQNAIHITGSGSGGTNCPTLTPHTNGFDATIGNSPSFYTYNESTGAWTSIAGTNNTNLTRGVGYRVFIRGSRAQGCSLIDGTTPPASNNILLSATGTLATGTQTINVTSGTGGGWNLVGNPFQAIIDWEAITRTNVGTSYYTFNPTAGIGGNGAYGVYTVGGGGNGTNGVNRYIGPGHSFWVRASSAGSIQIPESAKAVNQGSNLTHLFKSSALNGLSLKVMNSLNQFDEVLVNFNSNALRCSDDLDAEKFQFSQNVGNIATYNSCGANRYAINTLPELTASTRDTIRVHLQLPTNTTTSYKLTLEGSYNVDASLDVMLYDAYLNTSHNFRLNSEYSFSTIANNAATQGANRFYIVIGNSLSNPLPVKVTEFTAKKSDNESVQLKWVTASEVNSKLFIVERSNDGESYSAIGEVQAKGNSSVLSAYHLLDIKPDLNNNNYYRLKMVDLDGTWAYSNIQTVNFNDYLIGSKESVKLNVYPIPANNFVTVELPETEMNYTFSIKNITGNTILEPMDLNNENGTATISLEEIKSAGIYFIEIISEDGKKYVEKIVKQ